MLMLRITLVTMFWIVSSIFSSMLFIYYDYNKILAALIIIPGILPVVPLLLPAPKYGWRLIYICFAIMIQLVFISFDLLRGNIYPLFFVVIGVSLLYFVIFIKNNTISYFLGVIVCMCLFYPLGKQLYLYNAFSMRDICFNHEEYCGSSCYKDYSVISCKTSKWKMDVFHGSPGSHYYFDSVDGNIYVNFGDANSSAEYLLLNGKLKNNNNY